MNAVRSGLVMDGLPESLGMVQGVDVLTFGAPRAVSEMLAAACPGVNIVSKPLAGVYSSRPAPFIAGFCFLKSELTRALPAFKRLLASGGTLWVFWPGPAAWDAEGIRPEMGVTAAAVSACADALGLAADESRVLDDVWSGMRLRPASS